MAAEGWETPDSTEPREGAELIFASSEDRAVMAAAAAAAAAATEGGNSVGNVPQVAEVQALQPGVQLAGSVTVAATTDTAPALQQPPPMAVGPPAAAPAGPASMPETAAAASSAQQSEHSGVSAQPRTEPATAPATAVARLHGAILKDLVQLQQGAMLAPLNPALLQHTQQEAPAQQQHMQRQQQEGECSQQPEAGATEGEHQGEPSAAAAPAAGSHRPGRPSRLFWKSGDYEPQQQQHGGGGGRGSATGDLMDASRGGLDHARLHPKFLHSNATSHKWALGALAELLDNAMDEAGTGATYVHIDKLDHPSEGPANPLLLVEDDGGGMSPDAIRKCMSFGYSVKRGQANKIGQYGNGFKTSTMRLGMDALVLSRCPASGTSSVGLLSYTFLKDCRAQDVMVPIIDYRDDGTRLLRGNESDWESSLGIITRWSPYHSEQDLKWQLRMLGTQGTQVLIFNLWETDEGQTELDFDTDPEDVRLRTGGGDRTAAELKDQAWEACNDFKFSLRQYASILYAQWPANFAIKVRGKDVAHRPIRSMMKYVAEEEYRPRGLRGDEADKDKEADKSCPRIAVSVGFIHEAPSTAVQGFCVYHRNRLIKPFWRVYNSPSSVGRGVIGYLSADFVEPAHDKQDFEKTVVLQRLEAFLKRLVPQYWNGNAHRVGYQKQPSGRGGGGHRGGRSGSGVPNHNMATRGGGATGLDDSHVENAGGASGSSVDNGASAEAAVAMLKADGSAVLKELSAGFAQVAEYVPGEVQRAILEYVGGAVAVTEQRSRGVEMASTVKGLIHTAVDLCRKLCMEKFEALQADREALAARCAALQAQVAATKQSGSELLERERARSSSLKGHLRLLLGQVYKAQLVPAQPPEWLTNMMAAADVLPPPSHGSMPRTFSGTVLGGVATAPPPQPPQQQQPPAAAAVPSSAPVVGQPRTSAWTQLQHNLQQQQQQPQQPPAWATAPAALPPASPVVAPPPATIRQQQQTDAAAMQSTVHAATATPQAGTASPALAGRGTALPADATVPIATPPLTSAAVAAAAVHTPAPLAAAMPLAAAAPVAAAAPLAAAAPSSIACSSSSSQLPSVKLEYSGPAAPDVATQGMAAARPQQSPGSATQATLPQLSLDPAVRTMMEERSSAILATAPSAVQGSPTPSVAAVHTASATAAIGGASIAMGAPVLPVTAAAVAGMATAAAAAMGMPGAHATPVAISGAPSSFPPNWPARVDMQQMQLRLQQKQQQLQQQQAQHQQAQRGVTTSAAQQQGLQPGTIGHWLVQQRQQHQRSGNAAAAPVASVPPVCHSQHLATQLAAQYTSAGGVWQAPAGLAMQQLQQASVRCTLPVTAVIPPQTTVAGPAAAASAAPGGIAWGTAAMALPPLQQQQVQVGVSFGNVAAAGAATTAPQQQAAELAAVQQPSQQQQQHAAASAAKRKLSDGLAGVGLSILMGGSGGPALKRHAPLPSPSPASAKHKVGGGSTPPRTTAGVAQSNNKSSQP